MSYRHALVVCAVLLFTAALQSCGAGRTMILEAPKSDLRVDGFRLEHADSTAPVPSEVIAKFEKRVRSKTDQAGLAANESLTLRYRFIQFEEGSQFERWFWGGIGNAGEGSLTTEVTFVDPQDQVIGKIHAEGRIGSGFFGGSLDEALHKMADEVSDYTIKNFGKAGLKSLAPPVQDSIDA